MKMRTVRTAGLVGGLATGALLLTGAAAQATDIEVPESTDDLVMATPEALGGLPVSPDALGALPVSPDALGALPVSPDAVADLAGGATDGVEKVPGLKAVKKIPGKVTDKVPGLGAVDSVPGVGALLPTGGGADAEAKGQDHDYNSQDMQASPLDALPVGDLLSGLGGGLPVPLPF